VDPILGWADPVLEWAAWMDQGPWVAQEWEVECKDTVVTVPWMHMEVEWVVVMIIGTAAAR